MGQTGMEYSEQGDKAMTGYDAASRNGKGRHGERAVRAGGSGNQGIRPESFCVRAAALSYAGPAGSKFAVIGERIAAFF